VYKTTAEITLVSSVPPPQVVSIQEGIDHFNDNVRQIATSRLRSLNALDNEGQTDMSKVDEMTNDTRTLSLQLRDRIMALKAAPATRDQQMRNNRVCFFCVSCLVIGLIPLLDWPSPEQVPRSHSELSTCRTGRPRKGPPESGETDQNWCDQPLSALALCAHYLIVDPDASPKEIEAIVEGGSPQIFAEAVSLSTPCIPNDLINGHHTIVDKLNALCRVSKCLSGGPAAAARPSANGANAR
jgi:syntaxin 1B/2/3